MLTIIGTGLIFCGAMWAAMYWMFGEHVAAVIPGGFSALSLVNLAYFAATKRYGIFRGSQILLMLILPPALQVALGGFVASSAVIIWAVLSPMGALMFGTPRQAGLCFVLFIAVLAAAVLLGPQVPESAARIPAGFRTMLFIMNIGSTLAILFVAMLFFVRQRDAAMTEARVQNAALSVGVRKLEDLNATKDRVLNQLSKLSQSTLPHLGDTLGGLQKRLGEQSRAPLQDALVEVRTAMTALEPLANRYVSEQAMRSKRLLLADSNPARQVVAKMALAGTGVVLDTVTRPDDALRKIDGQAYDILCVDAPMIELVARALERNPKTKVVFMVTDGIQTHLADLLARPYLSNVLCSDDQDRTFTVKNITTTVVKLATQDIFGLEKYLGWGVDVQEIAVRASGERHHAIDRMEAYLRQAGLSGQITRRAVLVAEELLSNAIYDAPVDPDGKPLYNHLPRTQPVELRPEHQAVFRFACDGMLAGISVRDPFGGLTRQTILDYLETCYSGRPGSLNTAKGGAGRGLFQVMEASSLVVFNVRERHVTEVCSLLNVDIQISKRMNERSFQFFYE